MKTNLILFMTVVLLMASCTNNSFKVTGEAEGAEYVYYTYNFFDDEPKLDSVAVTDGKYVIEGVNQKDPVLVAGSTDQNVQLWFISEPGVIQISKEGVPSGTPLNDAIKGFFENVQEMENPDDIKSELNVFMKKHNNDLAGAFALYMLSNFIGMSGLEEHLGKCGNVVKDAIYQVISPDEIKVAKEAEALKDASLTATAEGAMFTDFEVEYEGKTQKLSDYVGKGKYVLVDFWASWCGPCRQEIPAIVELYKKYAGAKFEVLGVATWDLPEDTKKAMKELNITYPQIMNAQKVGSDAYGIEGIPQIILFAPDGTILKRDLRGEEMVKAVEEALKK